MANTATKDYVAAKIAEAQVGGEVDLSEYAKKTDIPDVSGLASEEYVNQQIAGIDTSNYATKEYVAEEVSGLASEEYVQVKIAEAQLEGEDIDLSVYALKSEIPDVSDFTTIEYVDRLINEIELTPGP